MVAKRKYRNEFNVFKKLVTASMRVIDIYFHLRTKSSDWTPEAELNPGFAQIAC